MNTILVTQIMMRKITIKAVYTMIMTCRIMNIDEGSVIWESFIVFKTSYVFLKNKYFQMEENLVPTN